MLTVIYINVSYNDTEVIFQREAIFRGKHCYISVPLTKILQAFSLVIIADVFMSPSFCLYEYSAHGVSTKICTRVCCASLYRILYVFLSLCVFAESSQSERTTGAATLKIKQHLSTAHQYSCGPLIGRFQPGTWVARYELKQIRFWEMQLVK